MSKKEPLYPHMPKSKMIGHHYRVEPVSGGLIATSNIGYPVWRITELWKGGTIRSPFSSKEEAIIRERVIAEKEGFLDTLYLDNPDEPNPWRK